MQIPNQSSVTYNVVEPDKPVVPGRLASNTVNTEVLSYAITKEHTCDKTTAKEGETVHNKITITNNSTTKLTHAFISNPTPDGASYVTGSVKVNGVVQPDNNMTTGFFIPDLNPGETVTIEYDMQITGQTPTKVVTDKSEFQYTVTDPARGEVSYTEYTDPVTISVLSAKLVIEKNVDKAFAVKGETLTYYITIGNMGDIDLQDIYFTDNIPQGTTFVNGSVVINEKNFPEYRPDVGYKVSNLTPADICTTSFQVTID